MTKLETHIATALSVIFAALALIHPGFKPPVDATVAVSTAFSLGAVGLQWLHKFMSEPDSVKLKDVASAIEKVAVAAETPAQ